MSPPYNIGKEYEKKLKLDDYIEQQAEVIFEHGLHCSKRYSGRYETIVWFTQKTKDYTFNLDTVRVPQKYPAKKYFKGPKAGQYSCNPLGKNPGDMGNYTMLFVRGEECHLFPSLLLA